MSAEPAFPVPKPVPPPAPVALATGLTLLEPQSRRETGPGILVVVDDVAQGVRIENGVPSPLMKWAEESYCVVEVLESAWTGTQDPFVIALEALQNASKCEPKESLGVVCYSQNLFNKVIQSLTNQPNIKGAVLYADVAVSNEFTLPSTPLLLHASGPGSIYTKRGPDLKTYAYPDKPTSLFATPFQETFSYATEAVSHTRNLSFLKPRMNGPYFDLENLWDEHTYWEFEHRSVENTMNTMVQEPYVNDIPTITGGIGRKDLTDFYENHFIFQNPDDTQLELISRTVGIDRIVDEMIFKFTHDRVIDWALPGVPPTNKFVEVALMAVVNVRGDRLYHEHITWDSASLLKQLGLLPEYVPLPSAPSETSQTNGRKPAQLKLPVGGPEAVAKMRDKSSVPSNEMFGWGVKNM